MYWNTGAIVVTGATFWLTLTWDVLKLQNLPYFKYPLIRLTLTWDVLKWSIC